jgi:hypothetical protein
MVMTFLLNNFAAITASLTALVACGSFVFSLIKWLDSRNRELDNQRYLQYRELIKVISGGQGVLAHEQILCVHLLLKFKDYHKTTSRIFSNAAVLKIMNDNWQKIILPEIQKVLKEIEQEQN